MGRDESGARAQVYSDSATGGKVAVKSLPKRAGHWFGMAKPVECRTMADIVGPIQKLGEVADVSERLGTKDCQARRTDMCYGQVGAGGGPG